MKPDFNWSCNDIKNIKDKYNLNKFILLLPFCSPHLSHKKWPHYNELIELIKNKYQDQLILMAAPAPEEINEAKNINAICVLNDDKALNILQLSTLIKESSFIIQIYKSSTMAAFKC